MKGCTVSLILLDFWGVIGVVQGPSDVEEMAACVGAGTEEFAQAYWAHRSYFDAGGDCNEYWTRVAGDLGVTIDAETVAALRKIDDRSWSEVYPEMLKFVAELKQQGYRLALLSNAPSDLVEHAQSVLEGLISEFLFSSQLGLAKPDPRIFEVALQRLEVDPEDVVFVDDNAENVEAARRVGMRVVHHVSVEQTRVELARLGIDTSGPTL
jgi:putative hydrolase of the HAD superfamily